MNVTIFTIDVLSAVAFAVAAVLAVFLPFDRVVTKSARYAFVSAMLLYVFVGVSNALEHGGITDSWDKYEDIAEVLFVPALAYVATTIYLHYQIRQQERSAKAERRQNELLLSIVDTVPGGITVVDPAGGISFSNEGAERILGLASDQGGSLHLTPPWALSDPRSGESTSLGQIASGPPLVRKPIRATWPDGRQTDLIVSSTPMSEAGGALGGTVVAFEDVTTRG
jgi:PAS domain S-box-containing protein